MVGCDRHVNRNGRQEKVGNKQKNEQVCSGLHPGYYG